MGGTSRSRVGYPAGQLTAAVTGWCAAVVSVFFFIEGRMVPAAVTGALFVALTIVSQRIARSRGRRERLPAGPASEGPGAPGLGVGGRRALSRTRAELVYTLLGAAASLCGLAAVALFVAWDQVFLGILAGVAGFALLPVRQKILEHSRLQEGIDAKAKWDRGHAADSPDPGLPAQENKP